ncbi:MAG TPA: hypothetical protein VMZ53_26810, partial [Kofleriaceae bacterium]|nr:hypothetical protein [Kofleriaceae bacterium]
MIAPRPHIAVAARANIAAASHALSARFARLATAISLLALVACSAGDEPAPSKSRVELPGTLWMMRGTVLTRYAGGLATPIADSIYPSTSALPDGRIVAIASRGDGETGEQLALVSPGGRITKLGPVAAQVRDPAVVRDATGVASIVVAMNVGGQSDLYRVALDGTTTRLTNDAAGNYHPAAAASRDAAGNDIVYVSSRDGDAEIYRTALNESAVDQSAQRLTAFHKDDFDPVPSPDGQTIVFSSDREGPVRLFVMASDGTKLQRVTARTDAIDESDAVFSRDGSMLAYLAGGRVFVRGSGTEHSAAIEREIGAGISATFSPDGRWLAVVTATGMLSVFPLNGGEPVPVAQG